MATNWELSLLRERLVGLEKLERAQTVAAEARIAAKDARIAMLMTKVEELEHKLLSMDCPMSSGPCVRFTVLGSARAVLEDGREAPLQRARTRQLLATLLLHADQPVNAW